MNLLNIISSEESIGGLEISQDGFRFSRLKRGKTGLKIELLIEEKAAIKNFLETEAPFTDKLLKFSKKNKIKYVIISLPADNIFTKIFSFPLTTPDEKVSESIKLNIDLQLPRKKEDIYYDWMRIEKNNDKKELFSYIEKKYIDSLVAKIKKSGLKIIAIESHPLSISRAIKQTKDEAVLIAEKSQDITSLSVIKNNNLFFSQPFLNEKIEGNLAQEMKKVINYHDWFNVKIKNLILLGNFSDQEIKKLPLKIVPIELTDELKQAPKDIKWLISLGAGLRGLMPRKEDKIISLMEIGTEKAYRQEKANASVNLLASISIALSLFFVVIFMATWSMVTIMQNNYSKQISSFNFLTPSGDATTLRKEADNFNALILQTSSLIKKEPYWSKILSEIKEKNTAGITINSLSLPGISAGFSITGLAADREALNNLKKSFETSAIFDEIIIPLNNLGKKVDIPFSMTFKIKDVELIYSK